jgi:tetratricopeptide (TPR) repeat protein
LKRSRSKSKPNPPLEGERARGLPRAAAPATPPLSPARKIIFSIVGFVLLPILFLAGVEIALHLAGYGYSPAFFKRLRIGNEDYLVDNDKFGLRFFPPELARSPAPIAMKENKPAGTYRIFLLGESAALGDPRPAYGVGRYLQALLRERYPQTRFEVVCGAVTAINSHAVLPIARECARRQGDLWIVYMGNNEMVGPFGATTVFGSQAPPLTYVRLSLAIQKTRLGQMLMAAARKLGGTDSHGPSWGGMQMFLNNRIAAHDPRKEAVYANFRRNLEDILRTGQAAGVPVILNTVAVNLKDSPPFSSLPGRNLSAADQETRAKLVSDAERAEAEGDSRVAARMYGRAAELNPEHAELQFRLAECLLHLNDRVGALRHFQQACDEDALPFRADSRLNTIIGEVGRQKGWRDLVLCDTVALVATNNPSGVPGSEDFYEHVHFNFDGNYRLARAWAEQVQSFLPASVTNRAAHDWASQQLCEQRLGLSDWNRHAVTDDVRQRLLRPPFTNQLRATERMKQIRAELANLRSRMDDSTAAQARELYLEALKRHPHDHRLHENFAEFLEARGDLQTAIAEWEQVLELIPHHHVAYFHAGRLSARQGRASEAERRLVHALQLRPDLAEGWLELGKLHAVGERHELALSEYASAEKLAPDDSRVHYFVGRSLSRLNRRAQALDRFRRAVHLEPSYWEARYALGEELAFDGKTPEARKEFEQVIQEKPAYAMAHFNLGVALWQEGNRKNALAQFEECSRLDPSNKVARAYVDKIRAMGN